MSKAPKTYNQLKGEFMPFNPQILDDLAAAGSHIVIDTATANHQEVIFIVNLWARSTGNVTIRNASRIAPLEAVNIARTLRNRLTLEE